MSFLCRPNEKTGCMEVGDSFLASHFIVAGNKLDSQSIMGISNKPCIVLQKEGEKDKLAANEDVTRFIRDAGWDYKGIELSRQRPQVVFKIKGDLKQMKEIEDKFKSGIVIEECPSRKVKQETDFLKGLAFEKLREYYRNVRDKKYIEKITIK